MPNRDLLPTPPLALKEPKQLELHGDVRIDNYFWLRERNDPAVLAYLQAENDYTTAAMRHTETLQEQLYQEMRARLPETDLSVPDRIGAYFYYQRMEKGQQYPIYARRYQTMEGVEETLLDVNLLAEGHLFAAIGNYEISPDHSLLAFALDTAGDETFTLYVKDLQTGELLNEQIPNTYYGLAWGNDNQTLFYTVLDPAKRPYQVYRHRLGTDPVTDELVFHEADERYHIGLEKSKSQAYIFILCESNLTHEVWYIPADAPDAHPTVIEPRQRGIQYSVTHHGKHFFITTNEDALDFRVLTAPVASLSRTGWQEFLPHRPGVLVQGTEAFQRHLVVYEREHGLRQVRIINLESGADYRVEFPEPVYAFARSENPDFTSHQLRLVYESLVTPKTVYDLDMDEGVLHLRKRDEVLGGYDPANYVSTRLWATAADGVQTPISLVHRKEVQLDGTNPLLLRGYGAYGATWDPGFEANRVSLLDRGFVWAVAHIRGGSEMGRSWYLDGKLLHKMNTFTDFIACAEHLIAQGYTSPQKLVIYGRSAGGLLMGAVTNLRPDLFAGVIAGVPFVDVLSTMIDPSIPLTAMEYDEWGDPHIPEQYGYMRAYSPYDNVEDRAYPQILATAGFNDPRVQYWEPAKWVAKLRTLQRNPSRILLKTNLAVGHSGASGRYNRLRETAFEYAFLLDVVGLAT